MTVGMHDDDKAEGRLVINKNSTGEFPLLR